MGRIQVLEKFFNGDENKKLIVEEEKGESPTIEKKSEIEIRKRSGSFDKLLKNQYVLSPRGFYL